MKKAEEAKVYKGMFIANERKKKQGGRIKCPDFLNKVEVYGFNAALHQSQVQWVEVRRYKREPKDIKKKTAQPNEQFKNSKNEPPKESTVPKQNKYKQKETKIQQSKAYKTQEATKPEKSQKGEEQKKEPRYKLKSNETEPNSQEVKKQPKDQQKLQTGNKGEQKQQESAKDSQISKKQNPKAQQQTQGQRQKDEQQRKEDESGSQSQSEDEYKDLEIIVGRVKKETNIPYKTKPFVAIMDFKKIRKQKNKKGKELEDPIEQILQDFYVDIIPIHARLPQMEMDLYIKQNITMLSEYAVKILKYDKDNKKKQLNRIMDSLADTYIFVTFSDWDGEYPQAKIHKILGKALTIDGECERFLYEHGLNDFSYDQDQPGAKQSLQLQISPLHKKVDRMVFTIDPATSTDLDDALSIQPKGDTFQIGIHIADVSSYLHLIDRSQIVRRTTSVYLPYKVYHMLESHLVKTCSLDPGVARLAFTVWVIMDVKGNVIGEGRMQKNVVKSRFKLSYEVTQNIITGKLDYEEFNKLYPSSKQQFQTLTNKLLTLAGIAQAHRSQRILFDVFENKQLQFRKDESSWPVQCFVDKRFAAKKMVQQFMIIGNVESARFMVKNQPQNSLVIHHPKPSKLAVNSFNEQFKMLEHKFKFENVLDVQKQLLEIQARENVKQEIKLLCYFKARRVMEPAIYRKYHQIIAEETDKNKQKKQDKQGTVPEKQEIPICHFALGLQYYTHFTSPMRRMADILVHQVLTKVLEGKQPLQISGGQVEKINMGRRSTKRLKKDLNQVYLCLMIFHTKTPLLAEGIISSFGMESVSIYIPLFDMQKEVLWKNEFMIHTIKRVRNKDDMMDVKLFHDKKSAKGDIYWVMKKFEKVKLILNCTKYAPLKLTVDMEVESEKGPFTIKWRND